jgi:hypothetical protein
MRCTCPVNRTTNEKQYSYYCENEEHRKLVSGKVDAFTAPRKPDEGLDDKPLH